MKNTDRLLKIGKKLEKEGLGSFKTATPGGAPAYFRSHGLQIIPAPVRPGDDWGEPDPFNEHIIGRYSTHWRRAKETLEGRGTNFDPNSRELSSLDPFTGQPEGADNSGDIPDGVWIEISCIMGVVLGGHWVPVSFPTAPINQRTERAIMKALRRKGLRPEIALTIIANRGKDLKRRSR